MIRIIDYGIGNVQAFVNLYKRLGITADRASTIASLQDARLLILPGVGHFDHAMERFNQSGLREELERLVLSEAIPILGVCVGMQMLADSSEEGSAPGLGWIPGHVRSFNAQSAINVLPLPHMGWNTIKVRGRSGLFSDELVKDPEFYFLHSYYFEAEDRNDVIASASYGIDFDAVISRSNVHGIQCHPEKSHHWGEQFLKRFADLNLC